MIPNQQGYFWANRIPFDISDPKEVVKVFDGYPPKHQAGSLVVTIPGDATVYSLDDFTEWEGPIER